MGFSHGLMGGNMKDSILMIRKKDKEHFIGLMAVNMRESGRTVNRMESEHIHQPQEKQSKASGLKARE